MAVYLCLKTSQRPFLAGPIVTLGPLARDPGVRVDRVREIRNKSPDPLGKDVAVGTSNV